MTRVDQLAPMHMIEADRCSVDQHTLRQRLGRREWGVAAPFGPSGWLVDSRDGARRVIVSTAHLPWDDDRCWTHASISRASSMPTYDDLVLLHRAVWSGVGYSYQVFVPPSEHVNIHAQALHLWGLADGTAALPSFGALGTI